MKYSLVLPAHNEETTLERTVSDLVRALEAEGIDYELVLVNDNSTDSTGRIIDFLAQGHPRVRPVHRTPPRGLGRAVRSGLAAATGDAIAIVMADASDDPRDVITYYRKLEEGYDCAFGSRFIRGAQVHHYPWHKLLVNRLANTFIRFLFGVRYNDMTNAFKAYRRYVIDAVMPLQACHFNVTVEIPLKAIVRGFNYAVVPVNWYGRESGVSKLGIREMGRKYLFVTLYVWLEKLLLDEELIAERPTGINRKQ